MAEEQLFDRALYKKVKGMDRATMEQTFKNMYQIGYDAALKEGAVELNTEKLRTAFLRPVFHVFVLLMLIFLLKS